ncbi:unnamed protein product [Pocillopora meandrina]|uniref:Uncharacterized protein n=1 Tax=Pocillopora meandrina TaxID=46732 RepID=A0AAU9W6J5_9CNID|nr:unnamed protein product [Pocillopora meandrina]
MYVQDRASPTPDTPLQPRVGEMAPIGMHVIPHQRGVQESEGNYIGTAVGIQRMAVEPSTFFHQRIANRPLPRERNILTLTNKIIECAWLLTLLSSHRLVSILPQELNCHGD